MSQAGYGPAIDPLSESHRGSKFLPTAIRWSIGTFARFIGSTFAFLQVNPLRDCHRTQETSRRHTGHFARACYPQQTRYATWPLQGLCAMLGQRVRDPLPLLRLSPSGDRLRWSYLVLLFRLDQTKQERWEEAANSIDLSHSSRKAWSTINKLTGRSGRSSHLWSI